MPRPRAWLLFVLTTGCANIAGPFIDPCGEDVRNLAPDEVSALGFSADEAVAWLGDELTVTADWEGRHSDRPDRDTILVTLGGIEGEVSESTWTSVDGDPAARCPSRDLVALVRTATFATADGGVAGEGTLAFDVKGLNIDETELQGQADVVLSAERQAEVDLAVAGADDLAPPDRATLSVGHFYDQFDTAAIAVEGPNYTLSVWKCDEQHHPGCVDWTR